MRSCRSAIARVLCGVLFLGAVAPAAAGRSERRPSERRLEERGDKWIQVETDHFVFYSAVSPGATRRIGGKLETLRKVLGKLAPGSVHAPLPTHIYVFKSDRQFRPFKRGEDGKPRNVSGYFSGTVDGNYVAVDASADSGALDIVYHEYLHYFIENNIPNTPLWLNEGLAELFSTFRSGDSEAEIGVPVADHVEWLRQNPMLPFERFFAVTTHSPDYNEARRQGTFYAQSWALAHFLMIGDGNQGKLADLLRRLHDGEPPMAAFEAVYDLDGAALAAVLERYVARSLTAFGTKTVRVRRSAETTVEPVRLDRAQALYRLGDLLTHHPPVRFGAAESYLRTARNLDPTLVGPLLSLARLREQEERFDEAVALYRQAIELDPENPETHARCGWARIEQFVRGLPERPRFESTPPPLREARRLFRRSLELDPNAAESLAGFARTFLFEVSVSPEGLDAAQKASLWLPSRDDILHDRIVLLAGAGRVEEARGLFRDALSRRSDDLGLLQSAESSLLQAEIAEAVALMNRGEREEAICRLQQIAGATDDPGLRREVQAQLEEVTALARANLHISRFNHAAELANRGDLVDAIQELDALLQLVEDPELRDKALRAHAEFGRVLAHNRVVELYNTALDLVRVRRYGEARSLLQRVLSADPDSELRDRAQTLLSELGDRR